MEMNKDLNLTKILKDAPRGIKLWSPVYGDCKFIKIDYFGGDVMYPINCQVTTKDGKSTYIGFTKDGRIDIKYSNSGCVLFPSKENMDWSTFEAPKTHKEFELNQKVLVGLALNNQYIWKRDIYLNYDEDTKMHCTFFENEVPDSLIIPYDKDKDGEQVFNIKCYTTSSLQDKQKGKNIDKKVNSNGFDYVDLGLPSGTIWATCNVGADKPTEYGLYFQWGDTKGYTKEKVGKDKRFTLADYKFSIDGSEKLELEDDAANVSMGGDWHMPTPEQIQELIDNTTSIWTSLDDVNGMKFISQKDSSKFIFIPAAGYAWYGSVHVDWNYGYVWTSMLRASFAQYLSFSSYGVSLEHFCCAYGHSVRGVIG